MKSTRIAAMAALALLGASCGGGGGTPATTTSTAAPATTTSTTVPLPARWSKVPRDDTPGVTQDVAASGTLMDGWYWATVSDTTAPNGFARFTVYKAWFGAACDTEFEALINAGEEHCMNGYEVSDAVTQTVDTDANTFVTILVLDPSDPESWQNAHYVSPADLVTLATGGTIGDAPTDYTWTPFPFDLKIEGGKVVKVQQRYAP